MFSDKKKLIEVEKNIVFFSLFPFGYLAIRFLFAGRFGFGFVLLTYLLWTFVVLLPLARWLWPDRTPATRMILRRYLWALVGGVGLAAYLWLSEPLANLWGPLGYIPITALVIVLVVVQRRRRRKRTLSEEGT